MVYIAKNPHQPARDYLPSGGRVAGYFCSYVPVELIWASGFMPVRILSGSPPGKHCGKYVQSFCCSFARSLLEALCDGTYDYLSAIVIPHTCDTIRNLSDIIEVAVGNIPVIKLMVPTITHTPEALDFFTEELSLLWRKLNEIACSEASDSDIEKSISAYNKCRSALTALDRNNMSNSDIYATYMAFQLTDPVTFLSLLENMKPSCPVERMPKVALVGGCVPQFEVFELLDECGLRVVWDDLATASRFGGFEVSEKGDPIEALARAYLERCPCPTKHDPLNVRGARLVENVKANGIKGVIFLQQAFCEFHSFDYPMLKEKLDEEGVHSIRLDLSLPLSSTGQIRTRLQAFFEMLGQGG